MFSSPSLFPPTARVFGIPHSLPAVPRWVSGPCVTCRNNGPKQTKCQIIAFVIKSFALLSPGWCVSGSEQTVTRQVPKPNSPEQSVATKSEDRPRGFLCPRAVAIWAERYFTYTSSRTDGEGAGAWGGRFLRRCSLARRCRRGGDRDSLVYKPGLLPGCCSTFTLKCHLLSFCSGLAAAESKRLL